ncbi:MAG: ABC transporter substrate-binding protein [Thermomicrobiales bacterium]
MRRPRSIPALLLMALLLATGLVAPAAIAQEATPGAGPAGTGEVITSVPRADYYAALREHFGLEEGQQGGQLIFGDISDIDTLNGVLGDDIPTNYVLALFYEGLVGTSPIDGTIVPGLADSYEIAEDGITYTFNLNPNATWHDGEPFTADDVAFTIDAYLNPESNSAYTSTIDLALESYEVIDDNTIRLIAKDQLATFLYDVPGTMFVIPEHIWSGIPNADWVNDPISTGQVPESVVGTGPFIFQEWVQGESVTVVRNENYWDTEAMPYVDEVIFRVFPEENTAIQALLAGEIDIYEGIPPAQVEQVQQAEGVEVAIYDTLRFNWYAANLEQPMFQDLAVRQAMLYALDRELMAEEIYLGFAEQANGTQPVLSPAYAPDQIDVIYNYDPEMAMQVLEEAGWTDSDGDGFRDKDLNGDGSITEDEVLRFDFIFTRGVATYDQQVPYMQEAWAEVGIDMLPQAIPFTTLQERVDTGDYDVALFGFSWSADGGQGIMFRCDSMPPNGFNSMRYCNEEYDALDDQAQRELDPEARIQLLVQQSNIANNDAANGILVFRQEMSGYSERVNNFNPGGFGFMWSFQFAWVEEQ